MDWTDDEVTLVVKDYFEMLRKELTRIKYVKSNHNKDLSKNLINRSRHSIENKHQNISAVMIILGYPFISGYKPLYNFQKKLLTEVQLIINQDVSFLKMGLDFAHESGDTNRNISFKDWEVEAPSLKDPKQSGRYLFVPKQINFLQREQENRALGMRGEELACSFEKFRLLSVGRDDLAEKVQWVAKDLGDGLGYDILSKNFNGTDKFLEVKTTKLSRYSPFFFSANELQFSKQNEENFYLYRLFDFNKNPQLYILNGSYDKFCEVEPIGFKGSVF